MKPNAEINELHDRVNSFAGLGIQQNWNALYCLNRVLENEPKLFSIVELGTGHGGLATFFGILMRGRGKVLTLDVAEPDARFELFKGILPIIFLKKDVFETHTVDFVRSFLKRKGKALIFCDNGNKPKELNLYAGLLKRGDLLMAHDYGNDDYVEVLDSDLEPVMEKFNLKFYKQKLFNRYDTKIASLIR